MSSIVVYANNAETDSNRRLGMAELGKRVDAAIKSGPDKDTAENIVKKLIGDGYLVKYGTYSVELSNGKLRYDGKPLILKSVVDGDEGGGRRMEIAFPAKITGGVIDGGSYLGDVITDVGGSDSKEKRQYLLGTITFRRCR